MVASALVAAVVLPVTMMIQAIAHALTVRFVVWLHSVGYAGPTFWHNVYVAMGVLDKLPPGARHEPKRFKPA